MILSGYRAVWILLMFDLPTDTKKARQDYTVFRKNIMRDGFTRIQYSVYIRHCASEENADVHYGRVKTYLPPDGEVRVLTVTDKQFERMAIYWGKLRKPTPAPPRQLELF
ncbi:MAG TPA: CRISPR-associated endonuclease Cas2 [Anaerohalosphaeraceae bacterium]|jgi:CRISPR-associated protein Cas2|nr:CRISPR-associated endonuclease Cas2 [Anaerohalosphaeraceae bacterium]HRT87956.1 CRISPR-associated endonuclease Cas2 [Anaerohalosphaeraceae bacterium]